MITGIIESKTLTKHIPCECKCRCDGRKCNLDQWWNNKYRCECKKRQVCEKDYVWNPATCSCENRKYFASIMDDSVIICDKVIDAKAKSNDEETKAVPTNFNKKYITCKTQNCYISLAFLFITIALLIAVSIYCYLKTNQAKQKHLLPYHFTNKLKEIMF